MFRLFRAIGNFFGNMLTKMGLKVQKKADEQWTETPEDIQEAFDLAEEEGITDFNAFLTSVARVKTAVNSKADRLQKIRERIKDREELRDGALAVYEKAEKAGNAKKMADAEEKGNQYEQEIEKLQEEERKAVDQLQKLEGRLENLKKRLKAKQEEVANLKVEAAETIADHIANEEIIKANEEILDIERKSSNARRALDVVRQKEKERAAKADVLGEMGGIVSENPDEEYRQANKEVTAGSKFKDKLAARAAARKVETEQRDETVGKKTTQKDEPPKI